MLLFGRRPCFASNGSYYYRSLENTVSAGVVYTQVGFTSSGSYQDFVSTVAGYTSAGCASKSITQLYAMGKAFNFIGGSGSNSTALGDRIVSGSVNAVAEQTSGTVRVSGTLALVNTGNETCDAAHAYSLRINPTTKMVQMCRP